MEKISPITQMKNRDKQNFMLKREAIIKLVWNYLLCLTTELITLLVDHSKIKLSNQDARL